ncbi:SigE family RNA polymerase sigma factor [Kitasatospora viridis]|uniref:RNA polymerase sigma-70 factor (Sigma-E family) n=1 Tax=Kitasatospora viridis TaxID=281105 RepID=A0A561UHW8_9ACTN|nr:SigE family RNA polymerase sigma factor [Kitasatospora viridis]TWF98971.1 RNA polymerase sigma-70 factor (sigma-E family) [Kitasatospora viridis]
MSLALGLPTAGLPHRGRRVWRPTGVVRALFGAPEPAAALGEEPTEQPVAARRSGFRLLRGGRSESEPRPTLTELYHAHRLGLVRLAILLVDRQDIAEDVVQEAFAALFQKHGEQLEDVDNALGYLRTSVVNGSRSVLRRRKTARDYVPPHEADAASAEDHALLNDEHRRVVLALRELTDRQREVLVLRYYSDLSEAQIAEALGLSRGAVKSTASRALDALEKQLENVR